MSAITGISVVIPAFNAFPYIKDAVSSIFRQSFAEWEIIIVDKESTDGTYEYINKLANSDSRVKVITQTSSGIGNARNLGIQAATFEWIACLDADDISYPDRLDIQSAFLEQHSEFVFVSCDTKFIDLNGEDLGIIKRHKLRHPPQYEPYYDGNVPHQGALFSKKAALAVGGYREFPQGEDYDLFLRLSERYKLASLPQVLVGTRILETGLTLQGFELQRMYWMYAKDCARKRRSQQKELNFQEWEENNREKILRKKNKWTSQKKFTLIGFYIAQRRWIKAFSTFICVFIMNPKYAVSKLFTYRHSGL